MPKAHIALVEFNFGPFEKEIIFLISVLKHNIKKKKFC
jgi:hypothetical protein